jgi:predicted phosphodiesterase
MRFVVISDIHANYEALTGIINHLGDRPVDRWIHLGDIVGYYAEPQACVNKIREMNCLCIQGNHDAVAGGLEEPVDFNEMATEIIFWTRRQLKPESHQWLAGLPRQAQITAALWAVHGSLRSRDEYIMSRAVIQANFELMSTQSIPLAVFFGHTHRRAIYCEGDHRITMPPEEKLILEADKRYLINPGGSGQPRDGVPGAPYIIIEDGAVFFHRAPYDVEAAAFKVMKLPFGDILANRLRRGA